MLKRCASFLFAVLLLASFSTPAFAAAPSKPWEDGDAATQSIDRGGMPLEDNTSVSGVVMINDSIDLYPVLHSYLGFSKEIIVNTNSKSTSGLVFLYLYNPKGEIVSHDWIGDVAGATKWKVTLPSSGTWRLHVVVHANNQPVTVSAMWAN